MSQDRDPQDSAADAEVGSSVVAALYASALRILARYREQWHTTKQIMGAEWALTLKSLWLAMGFAIVLFSVVVVTWLGVNVLLAYGLFTIVTPIWGIALAVLTLNMCAIFVLLRTIRGLLKEIGFSRSLAIFGRVEETKQEVSESAIPAQPGPVEPKPTQAGGI